MFSPFVAPGVADIITTFPCPPRLSPIDVAICSPASTSTADTSPVCTVSASKLQVITGIPAASALSTDAASPAASVA